MIFSDKRKETLLPLFLIKYLKAFKAFQDFKILDLDSIDLEINLAKEQDFPWEDFPFKEQKKYSKTCSTTSKYNHFYFIKMKINIKNNTLINI